MATVVGADAVVVYGLAGERLSPAGYPLGTLFIETDTGLEFSVGEDLEWFARQQLVNVNGKTMTRTALGGTILSDGEEGGLVVIKHGIANKLNNRYITPKATYAEATNSITITDAEDVRNLTLTLIADAAVAVGAYGLVVFDAPDTATAVAWLNQAASGSATSNVFPLIYGQTMEEFNGSSYFNRADVLITQDGKLFVGGK